MISTGLSLQSYPDWLLRSVTWWIDDGDLCGQVLDMSVRTYYRSERCPLEQLRQLHADLPEALRETEQLVRRTNCNAPPSGKYLVTALQHYTTPYQLMDMHGTLHWLWLLDDSPQPRNDDIIDFFATTYVLSTKAPTLMGEIRTTTPYIVKINQQLVSVNKEWLDQQYAGWTERLLVAQSLGLKGSALLPYMFQNTPTYQPAALTGIRFD